MAVYKTQNPKNKKKPAVRHLKQTKEATSYNIGCSQNNIKQSVSLSNNELKTPTWMDLKAVLK